MALVFELLTESCISLERQDIYITQESLYEKIAAELLGPPEVGATGSLLSSKHSRLDQK